MLWLILMLNPVTCRKDGDDKARPVIIHRAILGSVERMIAILTENYAGKWWVAKRTNEFVECYIRCNHRLEIKSYICVFFLLLNVFILCIYSVLICYLSSHIVFLLQAPLAVPTSGDVCACQPYLWRICQEGNPSLLFLKLVFLSYFYSLWSGPD